jgi:methylated-DNA-protein-cysteine methyltransferase-like protein
MEQEVFARVYAVLALVPQGKVVTYGQIARHLGVVNGARMVGWACANARKACPGTGCSMPKARSARGGTWRAIQRDLLEDEGVEFSLMGAWI